MAILPLSAILFVVSAAPTGGCSSLALSGSAGVGTALWTIERDERDWRRWSAGDFVAPRAAFAAECEGLVPHLAFGVSGSLAFETSPVLARGLEAVNESGGATLRLVPFSSDIRPSLFVGAFLEQTDWRPFKGILSTPKGAALYFAAGVSVDLFVSDELSVRMSADARPYAANVYGYGGPDLGQLSEFWAFTELGLVWRAPSIGR